MPNKNNVKVVPVQVFLTKYTDPGTDKNEVKLGFVLGKDIRFLDFKSLTKPAQVWLRDEIFVALGIIDEIPKETSTTPQPELEQQL